MNSTYEEKSTLSREKAWGPQQPFPSSYTREGVSLYTESYNLLKSGRAGCTREQGQHKGGPFHLHGNHYNDAHLKGSLRYEMPWWGSFPTAELSHFFLLGHFVPLRHVVQGREQSPHFFISCIYLINLYATHVARGDSKSNSLL